MTLANQIAASIHHFDWQLFFEVEFVPLNVELEGSSVDEQMQSAHLSEQQTQLIVLRQELESGYHKHPHQID